jgi:hypothetical protein
MSKKRLFALPALFLAFACEPERPLGPDFTASDAAMSSAASQRVVGHVNGEGVIDVGVPMDFAMTALLRADGSARGDAFHHVLLGTNVIEFRTRVTCVAIDAANNRGWVGGVITENNSTDPARLQPRNDVGRDIWWRVVDYGSGLSGTVDRGTFVGFEGDAGFTTSAEYCAARPWPGPDDTPPQPVDARTGALLSGNISVTLR